MNTTNKSIKKVVVPPVQATQVPTIKAVLDLSLSPHQIPNFRGVMLEKATRSADILHNHDGETGYHYRYPLVHYRVHQGRAMLFGLGEAGVDAVRSLLLSQKSICRGQEEIPLRIMEMSEQSHTIRMTDAPVFYRIFEYIPFSPENYALWKSADHLIARVTLLERILTGHVISLMNAMDYKMDKHLEVRIMTIREMRTVRKHGQSVLGFNLIFKANIDLPSDMALGRGVSFGFGVTHPTRK